MLLGLGCSFREQSANLKRSDSISLAWDDAGVRSGSDARQWLRAAHVQLQKLLPPGERPTLLTEDLVDGSGRPIDVFRHFGIRPASLHTLIGNFKGLQLTSQAMCKEYHIEKVPPSWPGFDDVWIPVNERFSLSGRLGFARRGGNVADATCVVLQPALFGDNGVLRTRDIATALRDCGYHVLALESRAHGQTEARYPDMYSTWGVLEADDLMVVADWLQKQPHVTRTGLIGYCWGANIALLAAWFEGHRPDDTSISPLIRPYFSSVCDGRPRYQAGVICFSPLICYERFMDELETPRSMIEDPVVATIQGLIKDRMLRKGYPNPSGSMRKLIQCEYDRLGVRLPRGTAEGTPFVRLMPYNGHPAGDKLESVRMPVLIVHAANDPVGPAQEVADLIARTRNRNVAAMILPGGGHVGFAGYAKSYYLSLIVNFFDPVRGAAAVRTEHATLSGLDRRHDRHARVPAARHSLQLSRAQTGKP